MKPIIDAIRRRRAVRKYTDKAVEESKEKAILASAMFAPSARNTRVCELVVVKDKKIIRKLGEMKPHSVQIIQAQVVIVVCSEEYKYWLEDASIMAEHIWLEVVNQGLATCWTQVRGSTTHSGEDTEEYVRKVLNIPKQIRVLCMMPIGYAGEELGEHTEKDYEAEKIHLNQW